MYIIQMLAHNNINKNELKSQIVFSCFYQPQRKQFSRVFSCVTGIVGTILLNFKMNGGVRCVNALY